MARRDNKSRFDQEYSSLVREFRRQAQSEDSVYLPTVQPTGQVDFVFIGMEPSLGHWARTPEEAEEKIGRGFKDFAFSTGDFILHHCIRQYLCHAQGSSYHITNLSKGAMKVKQANQNRDYRYSQWLELLEKELRIVKKETTRLVAIGKSVRAFLESSGFSNVYAILHYSQRAARYRTTWIEWDEDAFESFKRHVSSKDVIATAKSVTGQAQIEWSLTSPSLRRLESHDLTDSQKALVFGYQRYFAEQLSGMVGTSL